MAKRKRKSKWSLRHLKIEVNLLLAKVGVIFSREPVLPKQSPKARLRKAQHIVRVEYRNLQTEASRDIQRYVARPSPTRRPTAQAYPPYPVFGVDENGYPKNIVGETVVQLAGRGRMKAIRQGDAGTALAAAVVEQVVVDAVRKHEADNTGRVS